MEEFFSIMMWPLMASLLLPGLLVYLGLHIIRREIIFVDLALAQVAALGTCVSILLGNDAHAWQTYVWSVSFTLIGAVIFTLTRTKKNHHVPQEALIGIIYVVAAAAGILLLSRSPEGNEELRHTLVGDLLHLQQAGHVLKPFALYVLVGIIHFIFRKKFMILSFEPDTAMAKGMSVRWWDFIFYALFGIVVTTFVQIGGVLLVFSYLIVPAVCANFLASQLRWMLLLGWIAATLASVLGLFASYEFDLPTGAAIVCTLGGELVLVLSGVMLVNIFRRNGSQKILDQNRAKQVEPK